MGDASLAKAVLAPLPWESDLLGKPSFALRGGDFLTRQSLTSLLAELPKGPSFVSASLPAGSVSAARLLAEAGFAFVEGNLTMESVLAAGRPAPGRAREAGEADILALRQIAEAALTLSRFHADPLIAPEAAAKSRGDWIENAVLGRAERVFLRCDEAELPIGFLSMQRRGAAGVIDLIAVAASAQRQGLGQDLLGDFADYCSAQSLLVGRVKTQMHNIASLRFYEKAGFRIVASDWQFHRHGMLQQV